MELADLQFEYPAELVATEKKTPSRIMLAKGLKSTDFQVSELVSIDHLLALFEAGDVLVINNTKVLARRLFSDTNFEILFLQKNSDAPDLWQVLCPSRQWPKNMKMQFPEGLSAELVERGRTQTVRVFPAEKWTEDYFEKYADLPLPPYILKTRKERRARMQDLVDYQTKWAKLPGSLAAPTASLHFSNEVLQVLKLRGVHIAEMTLHVGLGTFLPITSSLSEHKMHSEQVLISKSTWDQISQAKQSNKKIWALGTTVTRALESAAIGRLLKDSDENFYGETDIFIRSDFEFKIIDRLLTNFHQPESTLLALVASFAGLENVKQAYDFAIRNKFRLFSYGDLSLWIK